ncbi:MAG: hypothetical protein GY769_22270 [bacterium]|nr:hypothetical protein [bacterium]
MSIGGTEGGLPLRRWRYSIVARNHAIPSLDALVVENDTWRALGADPEFRPTWEHPIRLMNELRAARPLAPGSIFVEEGSPVRVHTVVYDVDQDPICRLEWISSALSELLDLAARRRFREIGVPLLGVRHGRLRPEDSFAALDGALAEASTPSLARVWLMIDPTDRTFLEAHPQGYSPEPA